MSKDYSMEVLFKLDHRKKPLQYSANLAELFKIIVWYTPNENSYQSQQNFLIRTTDVDDEALDTCREMMNIEADEILYNTDGLIIDERIRLQSPDNCPLKLIFKYEEGKTSKTQWFLRHLRNSISHGRFSIIDNYFIGFDGNGENYNLFIKVPVTDLYAVILSLCDKRYYFIDESEQYFAGFFDERIITNSFKKIEGYDEVIINDKQVRQDNQFYDLIVRNNQMNLLIGFIIKTTNRLSNNVRLLKTINRNNELNPRIQAMGLLVYTHKITNDDAIKQLNQQNIIILDTKRLKHFVKGTDVITKQIKTSLARRNE